MLACATEVFDGAAPPNTWPQPQTGTGPLEPWQRFKISEFGSEVQVLVFRGFGFGGKALKLLLKPWIDERHFGGGFMSF